MLAYPDFQRPFILDTDASDTGIGGVLSQVDDQGQERVIAYGSRLLTKPERKYCVTRRELLAVVTFVRQYRPYLICRKFTLRTDHGSLTWLRNFKEPDGQLARWLERLQELDFEIVHRRGSTHTNADSRAYNVAVTAIMQFRRSLQPPCRAHSFNQVTSFVTNSWPTGRSIQSSGERRRVKSLM